MRPLAWRVEPPEGFVWGEGWEPGQGRGCDRTADTGAQHYTGWTEQSTGQGHTLWKCHREIQGADRFTTARCEQTNRIQLN